MLVLVLFLETLVDLVHVVDGVLLLLEVFLYPPLCLPGLLYLLQFLLQLISLLDSRLLLFLPCQYFLLHFFELLDQLLLVLLV